ncbi:MAG: DUF1653 domain-containing protein [Ignavibacteriales bacterium]
MEIKSGKYKHYKGGLYQVIGVAKHSETLEDYVVYMSLHECRTGGIGSFWIRPRSMFEEVINHEGKDVFRFEYIGENNIQDS